MQILKQAMWLLIICMLFACQDDKKKIVSKPSMVDLINDSVTKTVIKKFGLPYSDNLNLDSNSLLFYCVRSYDTTSLIYLQKHNKEIQGIFYIILPNYHRFVTDYADQKSNLLFFEGYSFIIDSVAWTTLKSHADLVLQHKGNPDIRRNYTDGSTYALYYNSQSRHGNSYDEAIYEGFDGSLKKMFLNDLIKLRKPIMHKVK